MEFVYGMIVGGIVMGLVMGLIVKSRKGNAPLASSAPKGGKDCANVEEVEKGTKLAMLREFIADIGENPSDGSAPNVVKITNDLVQKELGVSDATAERYLNELEKEGLIKQAGDNGAGVYYERLDSDSKEDLSQGIKGVSWEEIDKSIDDYKNRTMQKFDVEKELAENDPNLIVNLSMSLSDKCDYGSKIKKLNDKEKVIYFVCQLENELNNGGFAQYFYNSSGDFTHETSEALKALGSTELYQLLGSAIAQFPKSTVPKERSKREELMSEFYEEIEAAWAELDEKFFNCPEDLNALCQKFVEVNIKDFK